MPNMIVKFVNLLTGRVSEEHGPYDCVRISHDMLKVGASGQKSIATMSHGDCKWETRDGQRWTDFIIINS